MEAYSDFLQDLIAVNNDRIDGYSQAIALLNEHEDEDLRQVLVQYRSQTQRFVAQLTTFLTTDESEELEPALNGPLFKLWQAHIAPISGTDRKSILVSCEQREDIYKTVYEKAINELDSVPLSLANTIRQQAELHYMAHNHIKTLRDTI